MSQATGEAVARPFAVVPGGVPPSGPSSAADVPVPEAELSSAEQGVWDHVVAALRQYGLLHRTDGMALTIIVRTYVRWLDAERQLDLFAAGNGGSYVTESGNGYRSPHPMYYVAKNLKKDLLQWLPEACLTMPSFAKVKAMKEGGGQGQLSLLGNPAAWHATAGRPPPVTG